MLRTPHFQSVAGSGGDPAVLTLPMAKNRKLNTNSRLSRRLLLQITKAGVLTSMLGTATVNGQSQPEITIPETDVDARIWGDKYRTPSNILVTAENPRLAGSYSYESVSGEQETEQAPDDQQFVFIDLSIENDAGESRRRASGLKFELVAGSQQFSPESNIKRNDKFPNVPNDILNGVSKSGVLSYLIPSEFAIDDLRLFYDDFAQLENQSPDIKITWQSDNIVDSKIYSITESNIPTQIPQHGSYEPSVTVKNIGRETGTGNVQYTLKDSLGQTIVETTQSLSLAPNEVESIIFEVNADPDSGTGDLTHVITTDDDTTTVDTAKNPDLNWGVSYRTPSNIVVTAENPRLAGSYSYESVSGEQETEQPPDDQQFVFIDLSIKNEDRKSKRRASGLKFELVAGSQQFSPESNIKRNDKFPNVPNDILNGVSKSGVLSYLIPSEFAIDDLRLFYDDFAQLENQSPDIKVSWQSIDTPSVQIAGQTLDPPVINADSARTHTLSFDALNVSTDGGQDDFTVELPDEIELLEVTDVTVTRGSADAESDVEHSVTDNTITFSVNFETSQRVQDMSFDVVMNLIASDTATDR